MTTTLRLPSPRTENWDWQMRGSCRGMNTMLFFNPDGERGDHRAARIANAKKVCQTCAVLKQCRTYALASNELHGVWGGLSEYDRRTIHDKDLTADRGTDLNHPPQWTNARAPAVGVGESESPRCSPSPKPRPRPSTSSPPARMYARKAE
jgi:WhiB family redox-sensing transcriptional regulator